MKILSNLSENETGSAAAEEFVDLTLAEHYSKLYSKCLINFAERALKRMKDDNGSIIFISSPGCNITQICRPGYDMPGKIFPIYLNIKNLEKNCFLKALENHLVNLQLDIMLKICNLEESMLTP